MTYRTTRADEVRARVDAIRAAGVGLRALTQKDLEALCHAVQWLADDSDLRAAVVGRTGLSAAMVEWGLRTSVESLDADKLLGIREQLGLDWESNASASVAVVLSGNLFTACLKPMLWPLVLGVPVIGKATGRDDVLVRALHARMRVCTPCWVRAHMRTCTYAPARVSMCACSFRIRKRWRAGTFSLRTTTSMSSTSQRAS